MVTAKTKKGTEVYVTTTPDCDENKGGLYCQIYLEEDGEEYDDFCIHKEELAEKNEETLIREHVAEIVEY